ncbi:uncharacterized protein LOC131613926 [Vicia villosa]|uniref:uncharacterized protein LOC131613926 n=1 Tax=Vicia villosa TaxID=3911 RepID=UPI00273C1708|nr:uncharacterized protein LOC131613926 [Vicia villosa]
MEFWKNALIMYAIGNELSMNAVKKFMTTTWNFVTLPDLYYNEEGYFLIRFKDRVDRDAVLMRRPYSIFKKPILLHEWNPNFTLQEDVLRVLPIWVMFPQFPLYCWGDQSIGKIASAIGKPLMTDECTTKKLRVSYARVLIEVDVTQELRQHITIGNPRGEKMIQQVEYEWKPPFCKSCNKVGHECKQKEDGLKKKKEPQRVWERKKPPEEPKSSDEVSKSVAQLNVVEGPWITIQIKGRKGKEPAEVRVEIMNGFEGLLVGESSHTKGVT